MFFLRKIKHEIFILYIIFLIIELGNFYGEKLRTELEISTITCNGINGVIGYTTTGYKCFEYFFQIYESDSKTTVNPNDICRKWNKNGNLASFTSIDELSWIMNERLSPGDYWIGLVKYDVSGTTMGVNNLKWLDGSDVYFVAWNYTNYEKDCTYNDNYHYLDVNDGRIEITNIVWSPGVSKGAICNFWLPECNGIAIDPCSNHGVCWKYDENSNKCDCDNGYFGINCENTYECLGVRQDHNDSCSANGVCTSTGCKCFEGYKGANCQTSIVNVGNWYCFGINSNSTDPGVCNGHGVCSSNDYCECTGDYYGDNCQFWDCFGTRNDKNYGHFKHQVCNGHGECTLPDHCVCDNYVDYFGRDCKKTKCNSISSNYTSQVCNGHGECVELDKCVCKQNYVGNNCEIDYPLEKPIGSKVTPMVDAKYYLLEYIDNVQLSQFDAEKYCVTQWMDLYPGHLASIHSLTEDQEIVDYSSFDNQRFWIGLSKKNPVSFRCDGDTYWQGFEWSDGSNMTYTTTAFQCDKDNQGCFYRYYAHDYYTDGMCEVHLPFVCKYELHICNEIREDNQTVCNSHGACLFNGICTCEYGYGGDFCDQDSFVCNGRNSTDDLVCSSNGECIDNECKCYPNYYGEDCQVTTCKEKFSNSSEACSGKGICVDYERCICNSSKYFGNNCEKTFCYNKWSDEITYCTCWPYNVCQCTGEKEGYDINQKCMYPICYDIPSNYIDSCSGTIAGSCIGADNCSCSQKYYGKECKEFIDDLFYEYDDQKGRRIIIPYIAEIGIVSKQIDSEFDCKDVFIIDIDDLVNSKCFYSSEDDIKTSNITFIIPSGYKLLKKEDVIELEFLLYDPTFPGETVLLQYIFDEDEVIDDNNSMNVGLAVSLGIISFLLITVVVAVVVIILLVLKIQKNKIMDEKVSLTKDEAEQDDIKLSEKENYTAKATEN